MTTRLTLGSFRNLASNVPFEETRNGESGAVAGAQRAVSRARVREPDTPMRPADGSRTIAFPRIVTGPQVVLVVCVSPSQPGPETVFRRTRDPVVSTLRAIRARPRVLFRLRQAFRRGPS
jgi:hypothetical protein